MMEPDAPEAVLKGFLVTCSAGALFGAAYGVLKRQPPMIPAFTTSFNSGLAGLTYFALREYVVSPVLVETIPWQQYTRRREAIQAAARGKRPQISADMTYSEIRTHKLLDTAIAGSTTGSFLYLFKRGPKGMVPGAVTAGVLCTLVHYVWNELKVTRIKIVTNARRLELETRPTQAQPSTLSEKLMDGLSVIFPIKKISDEEYKAMLLKQREAVESRLREVRIERENKSDRKNDP